MSQKTWAFALKDKVKIALSGEAGVVVARLEALDHPDQFRLRYVAADGRQVEDWFFAGPLEKTA